MQNDKTQETKPISPHTELRRKDQDAVMPRPRAKQRSQEEDEADQIDDLFNDMPV